MSYKQILSKCCEKVFKDEAQTICSKCDQAAESIPAEPDGVTPQRVFPNNEN